jgi:hypothetical protein
VSGVFGAAVEAFAEITSLPCAVAHSRTPKHSGRLGVLRRPQADRQTASPVRQAVRAQDARASRKACAYPAFKPISSSVPSSPDQTVPSASRPSRKAPRPVRVHGHSDVLRHRIKAGDGKVRLAEHYGILLPRRRWPGWTDCPTPRGARRQRARDARGQGLQDQVRLVPPAPLRRAQFQPPHYPRHNKIVVSLAGRKRCRTSW